MPTPSKSQSKSDSTADKIDYSKQNAAQATDLIRQKLDSIYKNEPSAAAEMKDIANQAKPVSEHQAYMQKLGDSGMSIAEIQTAWHKYYEGLPDAGKREVWDEFYSHHHPAGHTPTKESAKEVQAGHMPVEEQDQHPHSGRRRQPRRTVAEHKQNISKRSHAKKKLTAKHHLQSLIFGLGVGSFAILLLLFGFFNERFIAPFITPSRQVNSTPIINDPNSANAGNKPEVIIPKINVEIPVVYDEPSIADEPMQKALERGVVHYATTPYPGQKGNTVIFGHSSNNIFNPGKYKFAFVLLSKLENGDLFYLDRNGKRYVYRVYKKHVVEPTNLSVLSTAEKPSTATLITCDPPGTSLHRLVVVGEQISPAPSGNTNSTASKQQTEPAVLPSNSTSLWQRFVDWL